MKEPQGGGAATAWRNRNHALSLFLISCLFLIHTSSVQKGLSGLRGPLAQKPGCQHLRNLGREPRAASLTPSHSPDSRGRDCDWPRRGEVLPSCPINCDQRGVVQLREQGCSYGNHLARAGRKEAQLPEKKGKGRSSPNNRRPRPVYTWCSINA